MAKPKSASAQANNSATDALQNLLRVEERLQAQLAAAKELAISALARATADAASRRASSQAELSAAIAALEERERAHVARESVEIEHQAATAVAAIEALSDDRVQELARHLIRRLSGQSPESSRRPGVRLA